MSPWNCADNVLSKLYKKYNKGYLSAKGLSMLWLPQHKL